MDTRLRWDLKPTSICPLNVYTSSAMANLFNEQPPDNEWNDFISTDYANGFEDPTLFLDYFVSHDTLELGLRLTIVL